MSNPATMDRRDVAHPTNPIGGQGYVEEINAATVEPAPDETSPVRFDELRAEGHRPAKARNLRSAH